MVSGVAAGWQYAALAAVIRAIRVAMTLYPEFYRPD